jgi:hypothetical protein
MSLLQRAMLSRRVGRLVLEHIDGLELVVLPDVFNPAVFRTSPLLAEAIAANVVNGSRRGGLQPAVLPGDADQPT